MPSLSGLIRQLDGSLQYADEPFRLLLANPIDPAAAR